MISEEAQKIFAAAAERAGIPSFRLRTDKTRKPFLTDSKLGGIPYWEKGRDYPESKSGSRLYLLTQINFAQLSENDIFPTQGILQFFAADDEIYGADFDAPAVQDGFRVIYHPSVDDTVTEDDVIAMSVPYVTREKLENGDIDYTPLKGEFALSAEAVMSEPDIYGEGYEQLFRGIADELDIDLDDDEDIFASVDEELLRMHGNDAAGHKLLGHPYFNQSDPRTWSDEFAYYDTLLFQLDSQSEDGSDIVLWGDCGVGGFFINGEDLKNMRFDNILYNWDCC